MFDSKDRITVTACFFGALFAICASLDFDVPALVFFLCAIVGPLVMLAVEALIASEGAGYE